MRREVVDEQVKVLEVFSGRQRVIGILQIGESDLNIVAVFGQTGLLWNSSHRGVDECDVNRD